MGQMSLLGSSRALGFVRRDISVVEEEVGSAEERPVAV